MNIFLSVRDCIKKHITNPAIQKIIFFDILLLSLIFLVSLCTLPQSTFFLWIFLGGILTFWNFFFVAIFIHLKFKTFHYWIFIIYIFNTLECSSHCLINRGLHSRGNYTYLIDMQ